VATVLSCSDSRVPVELLFDQGIGDVFTVRVAGNVADTDELGTIEYGVDHLETPVLVVMGHTKCGAVTAVATGAEVHGHIPALVDNIGPAVAQAKAKNPTLDAKGIVAPAITENVFQAVSDVITKSAAVRSRLKDGKVKIVGALYHLEDGSVEWLGEHPKQKELIAAGDAAPPETHADSAGKHAAAPAEPAKEADPHASPEAHEAEAPHGAEEHVAAKVPPPNPLSFAIVAAIACMAGAISMKLSARE
jgi:carbonic anhydrase